MPSLLRPIIPFHNIDIRQISSRIISKSPTCHEIGVNKPYFANFEVVQGFFEQQEEEGVQKTPAELADSSFGLLDKSPERWENFKKSIADLQANAPEDVSYKVFFCGRHGQGWHNVGSDYYGDDWEENWAKKSGNEIITWGPDAELTPKGREEALTLQKGWKKNLDAGAPLPEKWLLSPMTRAADTMALTWGANLQDQTPIFCEALREVYGMQTNDQRRDKDYLMSRFYQCDFEDEFSHTDPWWKPDERETVEHSHDRLRGFFSYAFRLHEETYISITSHSSTLRAMLDVLDHPHKKFETAEVIPLVVKAVRKQQTEQ
ncbi:hypothetical protein FFLO_03142 [Filobasidium floriforme]|uniref:Phosphoglycerate mutase n=1 Tax=Filobasidium floriforme TaxID=5210 RepID=A0A8K0NNG5_9TREE|nr:phosphoglycerate mutase [Filobasidium floriforme]KAG7548937.1 hypothetical protein FFLO_03142 [Filobasidium floriforme]KAH8088245.1 phosphoglycerate mutase [Filobasidium floriforme]